jgi:membrane-associated protease RseP (regulator of RpoE activity)
MQAPQRLIVIAVALALTSCTAYVHHDSSQARRTYDANSPCPHDGQSGVIGLAIGRPDDTPRGPIMVERVAPGSPAADANIQTGDGIRAIDGEATRGMTVSEAARLIRGRAGTTVELRVESPRGARLITLVRAPHVRWGEPHGHGGSCHRHQSRPPCDRGSAGHPCNHKAAGHDAPAPAPAPAAGDDTTDE